MVAVRSALGLVVDEGDGVSLTLFLPLPAPGEQWQSARGVLAHLKAPEMRVPKEARVCSSGGSPPPRLSTSAPASDLLFSRAGALREAGSSAEMVKMLMPAFIYVEHSVACGRSHFIFVSQFLFVLRS